MLQKENSLDIQRQVDEIFIQSTKDVGKWEFSGFKVRAL